MTLPPVGSAPMSYEEWLASLPGCVECGRVDPMDYIEGIDICAACYLARDDEDEDDSEVA